MKGGSSGSPFVCWTFPKRIKAKQKAVKYKGTDKVAPLLRSVVMSIVCANKMGFVHKDTRRASLDIR
jgi:hypothetical protein